MSHHQIQQFEPSSPLLPLAPSSLPPAAAGGGIPSASLMAGAPMSSLARRRAPGRGAFGGSAPPSPDFAFTPSERVRRGGAAAAARPVEPLSFPDCSPIPPAYDAAAGDHAGSVSRSSRAYAAAVTPAGGAASVRQRRTPLPQHPRSSARRGRGAGWASASATAPRRGHHVGEGEQQPRPVTVFGFPPEKASSIVHRFQQFGEIVRRKDGGENFLHIRYKLPVEAQMALNQNGHVFEGVMIGVTEISDEMLMDWEDDENRDSSYYHSAASASVSRSALGRRARSRRAGAGAGGTGGAGASAGGTGGVGARGSRGLRDVEARPKGRARSFCSKVMEYVFAW